MPKMYSIIFNLSCYKHFREKNPRRTDAVFSKCGYICDNGLYMWDYVLLIEIVDPMDTNVDRHATVHIQWEEHHILGGQVFRP